MNSNRRKNKKGIFFSAIAVLMILVVLLGCVYCYINITPISRNSDKVVFEIKEGSTIKEVAKNLKKQKLIRSDLFFLVYSKINEINNIKAGNYMLNKNMNMKEITRSIQNGDNIIKNEITITFKEGKTMRIIAETIEQNTINTKDDVFNLLKDKDYINSLINKYWFLDESILNENIYYPLEGYLAPDTYNFEVNASVKDIFEKLLDQTDKILTEYKEAINNSNFSVHQILSLASMVESEGHNLDDRKNIAGVFINRLNSKMSLGSDVTTYYASKIELSERDLYMSEINSNNPYNTRSSANAGKLPIGPVCNPSKESINATINYTANDYLFFVADKNSVVYFSKTEAEHNKKIQQLQNEGLWFEY